MKTWARQTGFTIVELLIVIVVIAVLAAISIVAYNGIQTRARDNIRYADAKVIMKALELYKADNGTYPTTDATAIANTPSCTSMATGYSYSYATDDTWMKKLVTGKYLSKAPTPPVSDCNHFYNYIYIPAPATSYNCPSRTLGYYVLWIAGTDGVLNPPDESSSTTTNWQPCVGSIVGWGNGTTVWAFAKDDI